MGRLWLLVIQEIITRARLEVVLPLIAMLGTSFMTPIIRSGISLCVILISVTLEKCGACKE